MSTPRRYTVHIKASAEKELDAPPRRVHERITNAILGLESNPRPHGCNKLGGMATFRLRIGDHRIHYAIDDARREVQIVAVGHRREIYRNL